MMDKDGVLVNGFKRENKYPFYGSDRYFKETERLFPGNSDILLSFSGYYGPMEFEKDEVYLYIESEIVGIVRQPGESLEDFEKRFKKESKERKNANTNT